MLECLRLSVNSSYCFCCWVRACSIALALEAGATCSLLPPQPLASLASSASEELMLLLLPTSASAKSLHAQDLLSTAYLQIWGLEGCPIVAGKGLYSEGDSQYTSVLREPRTCWMNDGIYLWLLC